MTFQRPSNSNSDLPTPLPTPVPTTCQHLPTPLPTACFQPPIPPERWKRPTRPRWPLGVPAALKGRTGEDRKGPHHRPHTANAEPSTEPASIMRGDEGPTNRLTWASSTGLGSKIGSSAIAEPSSGERNQRLVDDATPVCAFGEGFARAGANSVFHSVEADHARARWSTAGETDDRAEMHGFSVKARGSGVGGAPPAEPSQLSTSPLNFAALSKNSAPHPKTLISIRAQ